MIKFESKKYRVRQVLRTSKARYAVNINIGDVIHYEARATLYDTTFVLFVNDEEITQLYQHEIFRMFQYGGQSIFDVEELNS